MTDNLNTIDNAVPGTSRDPNGGRVAPLSERDSDKGNISMDNIQDYYRNVSTLLKDRKNRKDSSFRNSDHASNKIHEIENTLEVLGTLIDEHRRKESEKSEKESESEHNKMDIEHEHAGKRKKLLSSSEEKESSMKIDSDTYARSAKRTITRSRIDTSLPIYNIDSSSEENEALDVEITGVDTGPEKKRKNNN